MKTGMNASIGPGLNPSWSCSQPSWKTTTSNPKAAPVESRFRRMALIGMTIERKATRSRANDRARTKAITSGMPRT